MTSMSVALEQAYAEGKAGLSCGEVASYIPELGKADPNRLGVAVITSDGEEILLGDVEAPFTLQSVSKANSLNLALTILGPEAVFERVGMEPTGDPFNSLIKLETAHSNKPLNPMINAGAIAICALLVENLGFREAWHKIQELTSRFCEPEPVALNQDVYKSEYETGHRNRALGYLLKDLGVVRESPEEAVDLYLRQCSLQVTCRGLARMGLLYSHPYATCERMGIPIWALRIVNTFLVTCGMYNASGEFAIKVGIPAKSGVSGAIMALVPEKMGIGVIGPALDKRGNSVGGVNLLTSFSRTLALSMF